MNTVAAVTEFLPTDNSDPVSNGLLLAMCLVTAAFAVWVVTIPTSKKLIVFSSCFIFVLLAAITVGMIGNISATQKNRDNLEANIMSVYNLEDVKVHSWNVNSVNQEKRSKVTILRDGMDADVYLSQDPETYEPTLTPGPSTDDVAEWLSKK